MSSVTTATNGNLIVRYMASAEEEAAKLREQARKLKEEAAALAGTTVEEMESRAVDETANNEKSGALYDDEVSKNRIE